MTEHTGGTVRYHRAEYLGDVSFPWEVWFDGGQGPIFFTAEQGEAMGLTPEPAPLVVTCNGHSIELSDEAARSYIYGNINAAPDTVTYRLARLLRDARQDPQPASDPEPAPVPSDTLDFDAMPVGTVAEGMVLGSVMLAVKMPNGEWYIGDDSTASPGRTDLNHEGPWRVVYQPAPVSPAEGLRAVLAGRDDADELIAWAAEWLDFGFGFGPKGDLLAAVGDAARSGGAK